MKYCSKCGNELMDEAVICPKCGCPVENAEKPKKKKGLKIALIVFSVLIVIYLIGFFFGDKTSSNTNDEVAYTCTQDVIENLMELTNNPHSMKVYTVKYDFAGENPAEMVLCLYIEYKLVDSEGNGREEHGFVTYNVNMDERTFAMDDSCALSFSSAALGGLFGSGAKLSLGHIPCRICGRADLILSQIILDNGSAAEIPKDVPGRFICNLDGGIEFQGYAISDFGGGRA